MVVIQGSSDHSANHKQAESPSPSGNIIEVTSNSIDADDDDELLGMLLNLGVDNVKPTAPQPGPTAPSAAHDSVTVSRQGVRRHTLYWISS